MLSTSDPPSDKVLEGLYVSEIEESSQAHNIMALYNHEILKGGGQNRLSQTENVCKIAYGANSKEQEFQDSERNYRA